MRNKLLTPEQAAKGMLKIVQRNIKEMEKEGMSKNQIQKVLDAVFIGFMYGPLF